MKKIKQMKVALFLFSFLSVIVFMSVSSLALPDVPKKSSNTSGNMANNGRVLKYDGWVYYSEGGLAIALVECALCGERGVEVDLTTSQRPDIALFSESQGRAVVSISSNNLDAVLTAAEKYGVPATVLGTVGGESLLITVNGEAVADVPLSQCADHHRWGLEWSMKGL